MKKAFYAVEFGTMKPTASFQKALDAATSEADKRQAAVNLYENGKVALTIFPQARAHA